MKSKTQTASWLGIMAIIAGVCNYLVYPILMRHLSVEQYAEVMVFQSILSLLFVPLGGFGMFMLVEFRQNFWKIQRERKKFFYKNFRFSLYYACFVLIVLFAAYFFFWFSSWASLGALFFVSLFLVFSTFYYSLLQATEHFLLLGFFNFLSACIRLGFSFFVIFFPIIFIGFLPFLLPVLVLAGIYAFFGEKILQNSPEKFSQKNDIFTDNRENFWKFTLVSAFIVTSQSADVLFVRALFDDYDVAMYASVAVIVKFSLVFIAVLETISLPTLVDISLAHLYKTYARNLFFLSLLGFALSFSLLPYVWNWVLSMIKDGISASYWLWSFLGVAMVSLGFFAIFIKALIAHKKDISRIFIFPLFLLCGVFFINNLESFIWLMTGVFLCLYLLSFYYILKNNDQ